MLSSVSPLVRLGGWESRPREFHTEAKVQCVLGKADTGLIIWSSRLVSRFPLPLARSVVRHQWTGRSSCMLIRPVQRLALEHVLIVRRRNDPAGGGDAQAQAGHSASSWLCLTSHVPRPLAMTGITEEFGHLVHTGRSCPAGALDEAALVCAGAWMAQTAAASTAMRNLLVRWIMSFVVGGGLG